MQNRATLKKTIAAQINAAIDYLEDHILYNHHDIDITADFFTQLEEMEKHLEADESDETLFKACQSNIWKFNAYAITTIHYSDDQIDFLHDMRRLTDNLTNYAQVNAVKSEKSAVPIKLFDHSVNVDIKSNENPEPDNDVKSLRLSH